MRARSAALLEVIQTKTTLGIAAALLATLGAAECAEANLIDNGSFESASPGSALPTGNGVALLTSSTAMAGWTVFGGLTTDGLAWLPNGDIYGAATPFGADFLDLTGYHDEPPYFGVTQTIATTPGATYDLTFSLGVLQGSPIYGGPIGVTATADSSSQDFTNYNPAGDGNIWQNFTLEFAASAASTVISIQGIEGDQYIGLDNVAVNLSSAVPEPATWVTMLLGFAALGWVGYRKAKNKGRGLAA
jgi:hypothetical protein